MYLQTQARACRKLFEELVNKDLAVYEETRLRDLLLCRAQAPGFSILEADFAAVWERRLEELLERRRGYLRQISDVWEKLLANMTHVSGVLSAGLQDHDRFTELFREKLDASSSSKQPNANAALDNNLKAALEQQSAAFQTREATLQVTFPPFGPVSFLWGF